MLPKLDAGRDASGDTNGFGGAGPPASRSDAARLSSSANGLPRSVLGVPDMDRIGVWLAVDAIDGPPTTAGRPPAK